MDDSGASTEGPASTIEKVAAFGPTAALESGVVVALGTVLLLLTFVSQASTIMEPATELTPLDRAANALTGLGMLLAIPVAFRLHQSWRTRAVGASGTALTIGVVSLLGYGLAMLLLAAGVSRPGDQATYSVVPLGGIGVWIFLVSFSRADHELRGVLRWIGLAVGVGNGLLVIGFYGGGGPAAVKDPSVVLESPLLLVGVFASLLSSQIGYPIWAIWLGRRLQRAHAQGALGGQVVSSQGESQPLRVHIDQFVRAPIQRVYAAYVDPALMAKFQGVKAITETSGPLDRPGTTFVEVVYPFYRPRGEVLAAEPPVLHEMGGRSVRRITWRLTTRFAAKDDGTEITLDQEVRFPAGLISGLLRRSEDGGRMDRGTRERLATFAKLVEAGER